MPPKKSTTAAAPAAHAVTLAGKVETLVPSAKAMMGISTAFGGLVPALDRARQFDVNALAAVVHLGLGRPTATGKELERTAAQVCAADLTDVAVAVVGYLSDLMNGGSQVKPKAG